MLVVYGLFAIGYNGDERGSETFVTLYGHRCDSDVAGVGALLAGVTLLMLSLLLRRKDTRGNGARQKGLRRR
jgi:hypothetical protein